MAELPDTLYAEVQRLCAEGDDFANQNRLAEALSRFRDAWGLLPEPRLDWSAALWVLGAIGDVQFQGREYAAGRDTLMTVMKAFPEARDNPFLRLRLGQCLYELGEQREAANWLAGAFLTAGMALFGGQDPKYVTFIKSKLQPPPGGWPAGW
jgi:tetratricopeptide (TPR) repeat protein